MTSKIKKYLNSSDFNNKVNKEAIEKLYLLSKNISGQNKTDNNHIVNISNEDYILFEEFKKLKKSQNNG